MESHQNSIQFKGNCSRTPAMFGNALVKTDTTEHEITYDLHGSDNNSTVCDEHKAFSNGPGFGGTLVSIDSQRPLADKDENIFYKSRGPDHSPRLVSDDSQRPYADENQDECLDPSAKVDKDERDIDLKFHTSKKECSDNPQRELDHLKKISLPKDYQSSEVWRLIGLVGSRTVKIKVKNPTSSCRPLTFHNQTPYPGGRYNKSRKIYGNGFISQVNLIKGKPCPCWSKTCDKQKSYVEVWINTVRHVIHNNEEAARSKAKFSFVSQDEDEITLGPIIKLYGVNDSGNVYKDCPIDRSKVKFVCHDEWMINNFSKLINTDTSSLPSTRLGFIISYSSHKCISFGRIHSLEVELGLCLSVEKWYTFDESDEYIDPHQSCTSNNDNRTNRLYGTEYKFEKEEDNIVCVMFYNSDENEWWVKLPKSTVYRRNGKTENFSPDTWFHVKKVAGLIKKHFVSNVVYDIPTREGFSGAAVIIFDKTIMNFSPLHAYSMAKNVNVSCLNRYVDS